MIRWLQTRILRLLNVPAEPQLPEGSAGSARVFRSGRNYYRWRLVVWFSANVGVLILLAVVSLALVRLIRVGPQWSRYAADGLMALLAATFVAWAIFSFLQQRLNYELRWYVVTDRCLRVRSGILNVHEITTTFANIQEVRLSAGPLQNVLGLADVEVHSAGGSGKRSSEGHVTRFEGVDNAPEIRDFILARLREYRDSGLGEKDHSGASVVSEGCQAAAQAVLEEARALHAAVDRR